MTPSRSDAYVSLNDLSFELPLNWGRKYPGGVSAQEQSGGAFSSIVLVLFGSWWCFSAVLCITVGSCGIVSVFIWGDFACGALCYVVFSGIVDSWVFLFQKDAVGTDLRTDVFFEFCLVETY